MTTIGWAYEKAKNLPRKVLPSRVWSMLRLLWARFSFGTFKPRVVRHRYGQDDLSMELIDFDGAHWYDCDWADFPEIRLLQQHRLVNGAKVFDVGGNQCLQAMVMARAVGPDGFVWAIEPNQRNARAGRRNLELNSIVNCSVLEAAAGSATGQLLVNQSMNGQVSVDGIGGRLVRAVSIDDLTKELGPPDVLYIDVEGYECAALEGARETLLRFVPDCFVEVHRGIGLEKLGGSVSKVVSFFPRDAYRLMWSNAQDGVFREVEGDSALPRERFFLVALARRTNATVSLLVASDKLHSGTREHNAHH
jgi:FkbM family methyltransferase